MAWKAVSPGKYVWATGAVIFNLARLPLSVLYYIPKSTRPHPEWTILQSVMNTAMNSFLYHLASVEGVTALDLQPGKLGERFTAIPKGPQSIFAGAASDEQILPSDTGAIWFPTVPKPTTSAPGTSVIILHFHPGGYVMGDVRTDATFMAQMLTERVAPGAHVCMSLYRLASNPGGRFPAALQDALSAYHYLTQRFPDSEVVLSGDSAGGNIVIGLLRYIAEHGPETGLPPPRSALLFSPAIDMLAPLEPGRITRARNYGTDYLDPTFLSWGARRFVSDKPAAKPYMNPLGEPFRSLTSIWVFCGGCELFCDDITRFVDEMRTVNGNKVELCVERLANHDIVFAGNLTGWRKEAENAADEAGKWLARQS
ncbi:Alpha/Beta hydrolase protein [Diaporthe sp. PMI_573]|nr:Alpha/Beta hydrolase protein [Diaporthaceae sp. PMI_573]